MIRLNAKELRNSTPDINEIRSRKKNPLYIILDNVLDTYNTGSIFRLADALQVEKIYLCGDTETPPNPRIKKASINTWQWVKWEYSDSTIATINTIRNQIPGIKIVSVEQDKRSKPLHLLKPSFPLAIVVGNETYGTSKEVLDLVDEIVEIPMWGVNKSLNVMVSTAIVLYKIAEFF